MPQEYYSTVEAQPIVGLSLSSLRNYCEQFAPLLSADANPGLGIARRLTAQDVAILQRCKELRRMGQTVEQVIALIQAEDTTELAPYIDAAATQAPTTALEAPQTTDVALHTAMLVNTALAAFGERMSKIEAMQEAQKIEHANRIWWILVGVVIGVLLTIAAILSLQSGAWFGG